MIVTFKKNAFIELVNMDILNAIGPLDGRYKKKVLPLADIFSEKGLMKYRIIAEVEYLIALSGHHGIKVRPFTDKEKEFLRELHKLSDEDALFLKNIEVTDHGIKNINNGKKTNHDIKAVEYYIKERLRDNSLNDCLEWVHFALTSEDINNIAYSLMLSDAISKVLLPSIEMLYEKIEKFAQDYKDVPMLARTHGQPASPTTVGKEFKVFSSRMNRQMDSLGSSRVMVKLNGATGNYNAHSAAYPDIDWRQFSIVFIESFNNGRRIKLQPNLITTQIEPRDSYIEIFDNIRRLNTILLDFSQDMWRYISDDWLVQKPAEGEVGSSTMPHKINPINFENCEGNLGLANALFSFFSAKLPVSRLQRDLSDSTVARNYGLGLGYSLIAYTSAISGLGKIAVNKEKVMSALEAHPEVISEAIQTVLRKEGFKMPYEKLKELTRGKKITLDDLKGFIKQLEIPEEVKQYLLKITPQNYTGIAKLLV